MPTHRKHLIGTGLIALVIGLGIGYVAHPAAPQNARGNFTANGQFGNPSVGGMMRGGAGSNGGLLTGTVAAKDAGSITLNTRDGSSRVVLITPATTVSKSVNGTLADISTGATIIVSGTASSNGSIQASLIQIRTANPSVGQ